ncbi:hypothetical protein [Epilithonimonas sp. UC225_85]|uniref:hypothetical protein n=1 Tax=Epilithonimonas sp. UC225_85 TaxID=3350167 RepID=UPI0036D3F054
MKKLIIVFSKFLLISAIIYCVVIVTLYKINSPFFKTNNPTQAKKRFGFTARKLEQIEKIKQTDILVLGSSLATRNYDSRVFKNNNFTSFNLGTSSQKPNMTKIIAERYLENTQTKIVIIDVNPFLMLTQDNYETVNVIMNSQKSLYDFELFRSSTNLMAFNALIIKYIGIAEKERLKMLNDSVSDKKDRYIEGGFVTTNIIYKDQDNSPVVKVGSYEPLPNQVEALNKLIEFLKLKNINYILVLSPVNEAYLLKKSQMKTEEFKKLSRSYFSKYGNYYDSNDLEKYEKTDFMDFSHLNETGAKKFTNSLMPILKSKLEK